MLIYRSLISICVYMSARDNGDFGSSVSKCVFVHECVLHVHLFDDMFCIFLVIVDMYHTAVYFMPMGFFVWEPHI